MTSTKTILIALEGNIGVGKSTLSQSISEELKDKCIILKEKVQETFLKLFYSDPLKYAFAFQLSMMECRKYQNSLSRITKDNDDKQVIVWDRSNVGDYIFALWNYLTRNISEQEMGVYEDGIQFSIQKGSMKNNMNNEHVDKYVFLEDEPSNCKHRVENDRCNQSESSIPLSYYEGIDHIHFHMIIYGITNRILNATIMRWEEYNQYSCFNDIISKKIEKDAKISKTYVSPNGSGLDITLDTEQDILNVYQSINNNTYTIKSNVIYINGSIMTLDPESICVVKERAMKYDIVFYRNEFKRVLMYMLSNDVHVVLYK